MDNNSAELFHVTCITGEDRNGTKAAIARESPVTIILNDKELVTLLCSPTDLEYLAVGYLSSEGFLESKNEIKGVLVNNKSGVVRVQTTKDVHLEQENLYKRMITSGCGRGASFYSMADIATRKVESQIQVSANCVLELVRRFQLSSRIYIETHGVHSAALCDQKIILVFNEDIGRHNAVDKVFGRCLMENISTDDRMVITSGRISSEIVHKVARRHIPILVSISEPTNMGVRLAESLGITLISSVRGRRMSIYTNDWRIQ
ncbi:formate dehydrogenase accessory sulfurtransferase FdhD [Chloroflexota bacterium]